MTFGETSVARALATVDRVAAAAMRALCIACIVSLLILLSGNVIFRFFPILSMGWYDEIVEMIFAWLVFIGAAWLWRDNSHFRVDWIYSKLKNQTVGIFVCILIEMLSLFFLWVMTYQGWRLTLLATDWTPILKLPKRILYMDIPIAGGLMMLYCIRDIVRHILSIRSKKTDAASLSSPRCSPQ